MRDASSMRAAAGRADRLTSTGSLVHVSADDDTERPTQDAVVFLDYEADDDPVPCGACTLWRSAVVADDHGRPVLREWHDTDCPTYREWSDETGA